MLRILIVYQEMCLGGSTSNLLSLLNSIDYSKVRVDLLLRKNEGHLFGCIPAEVNILKPFITTNNRFLYNIKLYSNPKVLFAKLKSKYISRKYGNWKGLKYFHNQDFEFSKKLDIRYDVAIGYLEGFTHRYVANHVNAGKKIGYLHLDYIGAGLHPEDDYDVFSKLDNVIFVSQQNKESFDRCFPDFVEKSYVMPHLFSQKMIRSIAHSGISEIALDRDTVNFVTVSRIAIEHKGFDRVLNVLKVHGNEPGFEKFRWYLVGEGPDSGTMTKMIKEYGLENKVFMLGAKDNAYAYELGMDMFLQPSYYEGKPAAVYEAMILGVPPFVTEYASAHEQIENGKEGMIVENSENGIYEGLKYILNHPNDILKMKEYMKTKDYDNMDDVNCFYKLIGMN